MMAEMNGLEVVAARQRMPNQLQIAFLFSHNSQTYRAVERELGALSHIGKGNFVAGLVPLMDNIARELTAPGSARTSGNRVKQ